MCDCIKQLNEKILEKMQEDNKNNGVIEEGELQNMGLSFGKPGGWRTYQPFEYKMTNKKVNGTLGVTRKHTISIYHSYCPFCGEKIPNSKSPFDE